MPGKYMEEAQRFKGDLRKAGFTVGMAQEFVQPIARELGVSVKHVQNMMCGHNRAGLKVLGKINSLIEKNNGQNKPNDDAETIMNRQKSISKAISDHRYEIIKDHATGDWAIVRLVAVFKNGGDAQEYVNWLNRQIDCGLKNS